MLEICDIGHDEVCYEGNSCPACKVKDEMQKKIDTLQEDNDRLTMKLDDLQTIMAVEEMRGF